MIVIIGDHIDLPVLVSMETQGARSHSASDIFTGNIAASDDDESHEHRYSYHGSIDENSLTTRRPSISASQALQRLGKVASFELSDRLWLLSHSRIVNHSTHCMFGHLLDAGGVFCYISLFCCSFSWISYKRPVKIK